MQKGNLSEIAESIKKCQRCDLYKTATHAVPGEGNPQAAVVFIGEAPGFHEDREGRPFVGNAGKYLDMLLLKAGLRREDVFITNVVKHRPPENRDPAPQEIAACSVWLEEQLAAISPKVVVTLGRWSLARYAPKSKISDVHGTPFKTGGVVVLPMYHPAAALRSSQTERQLTEDFLKNKDLLQNPKTADQITETFEKKGQSRLSDGQGSLF